MGENNDWMDFLKEVVKLICKEKRDNENVMVPERKVTKKPICRNQK